MAGMKRDDERRVDPVTRERVDHALDVAATRAARKATRRTVRRAAGGYFLLLLFLLIGASVYQNTINHRLDRTIRQNVASEMRSCERVQAQRERTNVSEARQYLLLHAVTLSSTASRQVKARFGALANTTLYDPPTNCPAAVMTPQTYQRPPTIAFHALPLSYAQAIVTAAQKKRPQPTP